MDAEAFRWFLGALQDDPTHRITHAALVTYHERNGDAEKAAYHRNRAAFAP